MKRRREKGEGKVNTRVAGEGIRGMGREGVVVEEKKRERNEQRE